MAEASKSDSRRLLHDSGLSLVLSSPRSLLGARPTSTTQFPSPLPKESGFLPLPVLEDSAFELSCANSIHDKVTEDAEHQEALQGEADTVRNSSMFAYPSSIFQVGYLNNGIIGERVDFLTLFGENNNFSVVLDKIFQYLSEEDLINVMLVCRRWWRICKADIRLQKRISTYLMTSNKNKENTAVFNQSKVPKTAALPRRHFQEIQNFSNNNASAVSAYTVPVSPSRYRFNIFFEAAQKIPTGNNLAPCPRCTMPSVIDRKRKLGQCTRKGCGYIFCSLCHVSHGKQLCHNILVSPQKRSSCSSIGSKCSKKNLRRLL